MSPKKKIIIIASIVALLFLSLIAFKLYEAKTSWKKDLTFFMQNDTKDGTEIRDFIASKDYRSIFLELHNLLGSGDLEIFPDQDLDRSHGYSSAIYARDLGNIYYIFTGDYYPVAHKLEGADADTFVVLNDIYAKDKNNVYALFAEEFEKDKTLGNDIHVIPGADPKTFSIKSGKAMDKNHVYIYQHVLEKADPATYKHFEDSDYSIDHNTVFISSPESILITAIADNVDTSKFRELEQNSGVYIDDKYVYVGFNVIKDLDVSKVIYDPAKRRVSDTITTYEVFEGACEPGGCLQAEKIN